MGKSLISRKDWERLAAMAVPRLQEVAIELGRTIGNNMEQDLKAKFKKGRNQLQRVLSAMDRHLGK